MVSQSIIQIIAIQMKLQVAQKIFRLNAKAVEKSLSAVQKVPGSSTHVRKYCGALFFALLYDAPSSLLLRWDEEVKGLTQGTIEAMVALFMAPLERLVVRSLEHAHHPSIVPGIILTNPLFGNRICEKNNPPPEGVPLLEVAQRALHEVGLVFDQPLNRVVKDPKTKAIGLEAAAFKELVTDLKNVAVNVLHTAKHSFQISILLAEQADVEHQIMQKDGPPCNCIALFGEKQHFAGAINPTEQMQMGLEGLCISGFAHGIGLSPHNEG